MTRVQVVRGLLALVAGVLSLLARVDTTGSDPALQLVAAQALVEHGTLDLGVYRGRPELRYDLDHDYRVVRSPGRWRYYLYLTPVLDAPFVALARVAGLDMLRLGDERRLQRLLAAGVVVLLFLALDALCRRLVAPPVALGVTAIVTFGSPLISTLGTALWPAGSALLLVLLGLLAVVRRPLVPWRAAALVVTLAGAYLCRPATGFVALGLLVAAFATLTPRRRLWAALFLLVGMVCVLSTLAWLGWARLGVLVPIYYSPIKVWPNTPLGLGLQGVLLSPGRGLLIFCPFVLPLLVGVWLARRSLLGQPVAWLTLSWILLQTLASAVKAFWWGGNSYGPRLLLETLPGFALLAALLFDLPELRARRRWLAGSFVALGAVAILMHSGQGLFNPAIQAWNRGPALAFDPGLLFDWRHPQFLATRASVKRRDLDWQQRRLLPLGPGERADHDSRQLVFVDFHPPEAHQRATGNTSVLGFQPTGVHPSRSYLLELRAVAPETRSVQVRSHLGLHAQVEVDAFGTAHRLVLPGAQLQQPVGLALETPRARQAAADDARVLGIGFQSLRILELPAWRADLGLGDDALFLSGFGELESGARWTTARVASLLVPLQAGTARLTLTGAVVRPQALALRWNGELRGSWIVGPGVPFARTLEVRAPQPASFGTLTLELPEAGPLEADPRLLGLRLAALRIERLTP